MVNANNGIVSNTKDGFSQQKRFDLFAPKPFLRLKRWKMCCWRNHAPRIFYLYSTTYDIILFFLSFDKMPQMYKWSNEHDLVVKHKRHATSNNLVGFLVFRKTRWMFSNVRFSITFSLTKKLNFMLMKYWMKTGYSTLKNDAFISYPYHNFWNIMM